MRDTSRQPGHDAPTQSMVPDPETAASDQGKPSSEHTPGQQNGGLYVIHDMITKGQCIDTIAINGEELDVMKMLDELDAEMSRDQLFSVSRPQTASSYTARQIHRSGAENNQLQYTSWAIRRWKSQLLETVPWHHPQLVSDTPAGGPHNEELHGTDAPEENQGDGAFDAAEDAWSNMASASAGAEDTEGQFDRAMDN